MSQSSSSTQATTEQTPPLPPEHHEHPPYQAHHFDTMVQQVDAGKLGMWAFLATEILMFGGLFCAYSVWRAHHFEAFEIGYAYLHWDLGAINTAVLLASSFTMAWAVRAIQLNQQALCFTLMGLTLLGGVIFMCIKYVEYDEKFSHGMGPGYLYHAPEEAAAHLAHHAEEHAEPAEGAEPPAGEGGEGEGAPAGEGGAAEAGNSPAAATIAQLPQQIVEGRQEQTGRHAAPEHEGEFPEDYHWYHTPEELVVARPFFSIYFMMTGLHGLHVLVGMGLIGWIMLRVKQGEFNSEYNAPVDLVGLYWHLVDLVWIFLFPLLYLI